MSAQFEAMALMAVLLLVTAAGVHFWGIAALIVIPGVSIAVLLAVITLQRR